MLSQEDSTQINLLRLISCVLDDSFGTLWQVRETVWKQLSARYDKNSQRIGHPAVSLGRGPATGEYERVPMLHGISGDQGPVVMHGLMAKRGPDAPTSFGHLLVPVPLNLLIHSEPVDGEEADSALPPVRPNPHKLCATAEEAAPLRSWAVMRGLLAEHELPKKEES